MAPHGALEPLVERQGPFVLHDLGEAVYQPVVPVCLGFVLQSDFYELEGDDDEGFGGAGCCTCEDGEGLRHFGLVEEGPVVFAPGVVGGEFGGSEGV